MRKQGELGMERRALLLCTVGRVWGCPLSPSGLRLYRTEAASFAVALPAWAKAAAWASLSAVQQRLCPSVKKSNGDKGEIPKEKSASRVSQPRSWVSLLENTWIVHILDSIQVNTGAVRRSHHPFSSPVGLKGPTDRWADRPAIVTCIWWYIKCILRRAWGLRLLGLLSRAFWGNLNV